MKKSPGGRAAIAASRAYARKESDTRKRNRSRKVLNALVLGTF